MALEPPLVLRLEAGLVLVPQEEVRVQLLVPDAARPAMEQTSTASKSDMEQENGKFKTPLVLFTARLATSCAKSARPTSLVLCTAWKWNKHQGNGAS